MRKTITRAIVAGMMLALAWAGPAQAEPIYFHGMGLGVTGLEFMAPHYFPDFAGQVWLDRGLAGTSDDFFAYCVDATKSRTFTQDVTIRNLSELPDNGNSANAQPDAGARIAWLLNTYATDSWLATDGNNRAAALQLAIWEVLYDPFGSYNVTTGEFKLLHAQLHTPLVAYSSAYLASLGDNRSEATWLDITDPKLTTGQDFAMPLAVPEPGSSLVLFGSGLVGLAGFLRRRRSS
jgi:hypothetical protein